MSQSQTSSPPPASSSESPPAAPKESKDMVLVHGRTADGRGLSVLRLRDQHLEAGAVMPLVPGKPIYGDVVRLKPRQELPLLFDVQASPSLSDSVASERQCTPAMSRPSAMFDASLLSSPPTVSTSPS